MRPAVESKSMFNQALNFFKGLFSHGEYPIKIPAEMLGGEYFPDKDTSLYETPGSGLDADLLPSEEEREQEEAEVFDLTGDIDFSKVGYRPQPLIIFVDQLPENFPPKLGAAVKEMLEQHLEVFEGLTSGLVSVQSVDTSENGSQRNIGFKLQLPTVTEISFTIRERQNALVTEILEFWMHHRSKRPAASGVELVVVQVASDATTVLEAWRIQDVVPKHTGNRPAIRDLASTGEGYERLTVPLHWSRIHRGGETHDRAVELIKQLTATAVAETETP